MSDQIGFLATGAADPTRTDPPLAGVGRPAIPASENLGLSIEGADDGSVRATRTRPESPQLYLAILDGGVLWGTDLGALVAERSRRGTVPAPHHETVLAYLRGNDMATGTSTFFEGIQRLDVGDEITVAADGSHDRRRGAEESPGPDAGASGSGPLSLSRSLDAALDGVSGATVLVAEDLGSAALLAETDAVRAVTVHGGALAAEDDAPSGTSRALEAVATRSGIEHLPVRPSTEQFKKDLADLVRTQVEPIADLSVYAHYAALRRAVEADGAAPVVDATGPRGAGFASQAAPSAGDPSVRPGILASAREVVRSRRRRSLDIEVLLDPSFAAATAAAGHRPMDQRDDRDSAAVLAARRNAARFGADLRLPLLDPSVRAALRTGTAEGRDVLGAFSSLANPSAAATRPDRTTAIDVASWTSRLKTMMHQVFRSEPFARRPWTDQRAVLEAFEAYISGATDGGAEVFWRLFLLELWMREFVDEHEDDGAHGAAAIAAGADGGDVHGRFAEPDPKEPLDANAGKKLDIALPDREGGSTARRYPVRTGKFSEDSRMDEEISRYVSGFFAALDAELAGDGPGAQDHREATVGRSWNLTVSEKIIAIMQGRSYFVWDVKPSWWAGTLSKYVARTPAGIGLGDPVTMELAIREAGLPRVLAASAAGAAGKVLRRKGLFYHVVGGNVRAIDGPTEYSVYPANVSAKLPPKDPDKVAAHLSGIIRDLVPPQWRESFTGTVVMDANDIGRNTLGKAAPLSATHYELQFADNPLGQGREQTPMAIVFER